MIRKAIKEDIPAVVRIYNHIHQQEKEGLVHIGWKSDIYPTEDTAIAALERKDLFVFESDNEIVASAIINKTQVPEYINGNWLYTANDDEVMVLHTLVVDPVSSSHGIGKQFIAFYEDYARQHSCKVLRLDTNAVNTIARHLYPHLGYREAGIVPCIFNGIKDVQLVLFEKEIPMHEI